MELILFVALTSGSLLSSFVYAATSAAFVQSISCLIIILATLFIIFYLPESLGMCPDKDEVPEEEKEVVVTISDQIVSELSKETLEKRDDPPKYETIEKPPLGDKLPCSRLPFAGCPATTWLIPGGTPWQLCHTPCSVACVSFRWLPFALLRTQPT